MNVTKLYFASSILLFISITAVHGAKPARVVSKTGATKESSMVAENMRFAETQLNYAVECIKLAQQNHTQQGDKKERVVPRTLNPDGSLSIVSSGDWTSGFFPGTLWLMYEYTKDDRWKSLAASYTELLERQKYNRGTHDLGFMLYCSYGTGYRLTGDTTYRDVLLQSAETLITRYNDTAKCIRSWDFAPEVWNYPVIIDNMMNLELLMWAFKQSGDSLYYNVAINHANSTLKNHFRADNSSFHVVDYNDKQGGVIKKTTHQGYCDDSAWARGQAWGLYGFTMMFRETGNKEYLAQAEKIAKFIFTHKNLPTDLIPYWDFDLPDFKTAPRDVSAAACMASALYELSTFDLVKSKEYRVLADKIIDNISDHYRAAPMSAEGFLLLHSTGHKPRESEVDVPLVYADYYYMEALLRRNALEQKTL